MTNELSRLLEKTNQESLARADLVPKILERIDAAKTAHIRQQKIIWSSISLVFFVCTIATGWNAYTRLASSDLGNYFSLAFSDTSFIVSAWREFVLSIIESLPIIGIGLFLTSTYLLFWSARKYTIKGERFAY